MLLFFLELTLLTRGTPGTSFKGSTIHVGSSSTRPDADVPPTLCNLQRHTPRGPTLVGASGSNEAFLPIPDHVFLQEGWQALEVQFDHSLPQ